MSTTSSTPSSMPQKGIVCAVRVPTDNEGRLLRDALAQNLRFLKQTGIHGVLALGSTGEFPYFTIEERKAVLEAIAELAAPLPVIANISDIRPRAVTELGRFVRNLGLPAVAIMPPGFYPTPQDDLLAHFLHAAEAAELPTLLYNFPELTGTKIDLETVSGFAERAPIAGFKQSGDDFAYHRELIALGREKNFVVFSGADTRLPETLALGAVGCIGGLVNIVPELMLQLFNACHENHRGDLGSAFERVAAVGAALDTLPFPLNIAAGMEARGLNPGAAKGRISQNTRAHYEMVVESLRAQFESWSLVSPNNVRAVA